MGGGEGAEIVYALRNDPTLASLALNNIGEAGQLTRRIYQRRLPEDPNQDYYYIIRETKPLESILVEYGFIDNTNDANKLRNNLNTYVEAVVKAIAEYSNVPYTPPGTSEDAYIVQRGDTLYKIANMFNTSVSELKRINNLTSDTLNVGQVLQIRETTNLPSNTTTYTVKKGDSLYSIASQFSTNVDTIKRLNNLTSNTILIGQQLKVPSISLDEGIENNYMIYRVVKGDSLWSIAQRFGVTVDDIINLNNLSTINLQIGDELKIPVTNIGKTYTVKSGDSLWSIARENNTTVDNLKSANNLTSNLLTIGQVLIIPN